ncbi:MAG: hypothetical protein L3J93_01055 [Thermoplasmata archaeon]|nr:hypothetical protein [Thermoplasmata archaeon]
MKLETGIVREAGEHALPRTMTAPVRRGPGRPKMRYRPVIRSAKDVDRLRRRRIPVFLLTQEWVTRCGYPVRFQPWLAIPETLAGSVDSAFRLLPVRDADALREPGLPELVAFLLRTDPLAARAVATRNRRALDRHELYRRVRNEGLERPATRIRLQQLAPSLPRIGEPLPLEDLQWVDENNPPLSGTS